MSKQIYWGVINKKTWGKRGKWPQRFHFRASDAKQEARRWNEIEQGFKKPRALYVVERFLIENKGQVHFDMYEHSVLRTEKPSVNT